MLIFAALLHLLPLQPPRDGARCYGSPVRLAEDQLPSNDNNLAAMVSDEFAFIDPRTSKPIGYLYLNYGYETQQYAYQDDGAFLQFTPLATKEQRELPGINQLTLQTNNPIPLTADQRADLEQHLFDGGIVLAGCFTGSFTIRE